MWQCKYKTIIRENKTDGCVFRRLPLRQNKDSMIRFDHLAIYALDLENVRDFFIRFFSAQSNAQYHNPRTGLRTYFLTFPDGSRIEIMNRPETSSCPGSPYRAGYAHVAFSVGGKKNVDEMTRLLEDNGFPVLSGPRMTGDGYYESCVSGPEGNLIEITE